MSLGHVSEQYIKEIPLVAILGNSSGRSFGPLGLTPNAASKIPLQSLVAIKLLGNMILLVLGFVVLGQLSGQIGPQDPSKRVRLERWCRTQLKSTVTFSVPPSKAKI